jgi:hypothetical protein
MRPWQCGLVLVLLAGARSWRWAAIARAVAPLLQIKTRRAAAPPPLVTRAALTRAISG